MYKKYIFALSDSFGTCYGTTHGTLTDVKKRSKTNFLPNFVSFRGQGRFPHEVKVEVNYEIKVQKDLTDENGCYFSISKLNSYEDLP